MSNKPDPNSIIWDESGITWDEPKEVKKKEGNFLLETAKNVPSSTINYFGNIIKGIASLPGMAEKAFAHDPRQGQDVIARWDAYPEEKNAALESLKQRYGGWDNLANTIKTDPVGVLGDISLIYGKVDPSRLVTAPIKGATKWLTNKAPERLAQSATKMQTGLPLQTREAATQAMLDQPVLKTLKGRYELTKQNIQNIENQTKNAIAQADAQGLTAQASDVSNALDDMAKTPDMSHGPLWEQNQAAIQSVKDRFLNNPNTIATPTPLGVIPGSEYPLSMAQSMKKATYADITRENAKAYINSMRGGSRGVSPEIGAMQEQAKVLADQVYEGLATQYPELRALGKTEGANIALKHQLENAIPRVMNTEIMNLGIPAGAALGEMMAGKPGMFAMVGAKMVERIPAIKAALAVALYKAGKTSKFVPPVGQMAPYAYATGKYFNPEDTNE